jgi:hypothetical protein
MVFRAPPQACSRLVPVFAADNLTSHNLAEGPYCPVLTSGRSILPCFD